MPKTKKKSHARQAKENKLRARERRAAEKKRKQNISDCISGDKSTVTVEKILPQETLSKDPFVHVSHEELLQGVSNTDVLVGDIEVPIVIVECQYWELKQNSEKGLDFYHLHHYAKLTSAR